MAELKTKQTEASVDAFVDRIADERMRADCRTVLAMMRRVTGSAPKMWGASIVGFGQYHYKYASGREGDWFLTGFSPRKRNLTLYLASGFDRARDLMDQLGKHTTGKACLYVKSLQDIDVQVLEQLVVDSVERLKATQS